MSEQAKTKHRKIAIAPKDFIFLPKKGGYSVFLVENSLFTKNPKNNFD